MVVKVSDTGIGIPTHLKRQSSTATSRCTLGTRRDGLGLAIVKGYVLAHRGRVWVESQEGRAAASGSPFPWRCPSHETPGAHRDADGALGLQHGALDAADLVDGSRPARPGRRRPGRGGNPSAAVRILEDVVRRFPDARVTIRPLRFVARARPQRERRSRYRQASAHLDGSSANTRRAHMPRMPGLCGSLSARTSRARSSSTGCSSA